jgi:hypothetical protein
MVKSIIAVGAAAVVAALFIGFVPPPEPAAAAGQADIPSLAIATVGAAPIPAASAQADNTCTQAWPYYEQSCLHHNANVNAKTRVVRVITEDKSVANRALRARR